MARTRTFADLIADVRQRTNQEESDFVSDDEIGEYLNQEIAELYSHVVQGAGQPYYRTTLGLAVVVGTSLYALPADFWRLQEVSGKLASGRAFHLRPFMPAERAGLVDSIAWPYSGDAIESYRIQGPNIEFLPNRTAFTATLFYTPTCPRLVASTDTFDGINGWEVAAIYGACATIKDKEETDPTYYQGLKDRIYAQIDSLVPDKDSGEPERIQDVNPRRGRYGRRGGW